MDTPENNIDLIPGTEWDDQLLKSGLEASASELAIEDFYTSSLWNYCWGNVSDGNKWEITDCGRPSASFSFDTLAIFRIEGNGVDFPDSVKKAWKAANTASKVMISTYILGTGSTILTLAAGLSGLLFRRGSSVTTIFANVCFHSRLALMPVLYLLTCRRCRLGSSSSWLHP